MKKIRKHKILIVLGIILLLAAFLRLYNISQYHTFLGDEGRDALIAKGILEGNFTLLGPRASAGDFYTGPVYYYMMAPFLWLAGYDPVGPAIMIALLSVLTTYLIYRFGKEWFGERAGIFAAGLYAVSPLVIIYSRSSWNPNPMPFFSLIILYLLYKAVQMHSWKLYLLTGVLFGIAFQLHYIEVFLAIIIFLFILLSPLAGTLKEKGSGFSYYFTSRIKAYLQFFAGFLIGFSPFLAFEVRHGFPNGKTILKFIFSQNSSTEYVGTHDTFIEIISNVFFRIFGRLVMRYPPPEIQKDFSFDTLQIWSVAVIIVSITSLFILFRHKNKLTILLFSLWLFVGVVLFGFYKKPIYDYYFAFMFPLPFLLVGNALGEGLTSFIKHKWTTYIGTSVFFGLIVLSFTDIPFKYSPNTQKQKAQKAADFVISKTDNKPFNFALVTKGNSDHAIRYFLHIRGRDPVTIDNTLSDPSRKSVTDQLLVVCDYKDCSPLGHSLFEVAGFGRAEIAGKWDIGEVVVFKLVRYTGTEK